MVTQAVGLRRNLTDFVAALLSRVDASTLVHTPIQIFTKT